MKVLVADHLAPEAAEGLLALGLSVRVEPDLTVDTLPRHVGDADVLVVDETAVTRRTLEAGQRLILVVRAGEGTDAIDVAAASERAILVAHCPHHDAGARAEFGLGALIGLDRNGSPGGAEGSDVGPAGHGLRGRSFGLYGFDPAAERLASAAAGLGMRVRVYDDAMTPTMAAEAGYGVAHDPDELFRRSEVVSIHRSSGGPLPLVDSRRLASLADEGFVLAVDGLGSLDLKALAKEVKAGRLRAAIDAPVRGVEAETESALAALAKLDGARVTRGLAGRTREAWRSAATEVVRAIHGFLQSGTLEHCVNLATDLAPAATLVVRHRHDPGTLVAIYDVLREEGIQVLGAATLLFTDRSAACLHLRLDAVPGPAALDRIRRNQKVLRVDLEG